jgi:hypothetical protein
LYNEAVSPEEQWFMNSELERMWREKADAFFRVISGINLEKVRKTTKPAL